ncbi:Uncharacterised protein [Mycobacterium tuberculosis]|nr:Uncharacterised protein [Mycobacterium tuberculosis]
MGSIRLTFRCSIEKIGTFTSVGAVTMPLPKLIVVLKLTANSVRFCWDVP